MMTLVGAGLAGGGGTQLFPKEVLSSGRKRPACHAMLRRSTVLILGEGQNTEQGKASQGQLDHRDLGK